jgi:hypothetical protein
MQVCVLLFVSESQLTSTGVLVTITVWGRREISA